MDKLRWSVDSMIFRHGTYFGFGWVFHEEKEIQELKLVARSANGLIQCIHAEIGKPRSDLAKQFPQFPDAYNSGFLMLGGVRGNENGSAAFSLFGTFSDGFSFELAVPATHIISLDGRENINNYVFARQLRMMTRRGLILIKNGEFDLLKQKLKRQLTLRNEVHAPKSNLIEDNLSPQERRSVLLIIDHDLGGGANQYRERLVEEKIDAGTTVFICTFQVSTLSTILLIKSESRDERLTIPGYDFLLNLASKLVFHEVIYNTGVSFAMPEGIPILLSSLKKTYDLRLTLLVHDFFMVCPSHFLIDDRGNYCDIPHISRCQKCLVNNQSGFATLFRSRDIQEWRKLWGDLIDIADQIVTFSDNTLSLLKKAYPSLPMTHVSVIPHSVTHLASEPLTPTFVECLKIGVVGQIGYHKGAKFVQLLAQEILERKLNLNIVIIGEIEIKCESSVVSQTGAYQRDQLSSIIQREGVNTLLFPSICPETFSYVVHELINLELPVACFDMGAPADRLTQYSKGLVLKGFDPSSILDQLILFHQKTYLLH